MAHCMDKSIFEAAVNELAEQQRICEDVERCFGWKPESVRFLNRSVCFVTVRGSFSCAVEFLFAGSQLVGVPPKKRWEK